MIHVFMGGDSRKCKLQILLPPLPGAGVLGMWLHTRFWGSWGGTQLAWQTALAPQPTDVFWTEKSHKISTCNHTQIPFFCIPVSKHVSGLAPANQSV